MHACMAGQKMKLPICPVCKKFDISLMVFHNPVEDRTKCQICMTFGSILYMIGEEQSRKSGLYAGLKERFICARIYAHHFIAAA